MCVWVRGCKGAGASARAGGRHVVVVVVAAACSAALLQVAMQRGRLCASNVNPATGCDQAKGVAWRATFRYKAVHAPTMRIRCPHKGRRICRFV